jgi:hypothetical protein
MVTRRCTSFGEAVIMIANDPDVFGNLTSSNASIMDLLKTPPSGLHIMMTTRSMKTHSSSTLTPGKTMNMALIV